MSGQKNIYVGYQAYGQWFRALAAEYGMTPTEWYLAGGLERGFVQMAIDKGAYSIDPGGVLNALLPGNASMTVNFQPESPQLTVTKVSISLSGTLALVWQGQMPAWEFLSDNWPSPQTFGSPAADYYSASGGEIFYGGSGDDIIELDPSGLWDVSTAYGGEGRDTFVLFTENGTLVLGDYQRGEKILFMEYASLTDLAGDLRGVSDTPSGVTFHFVSGPGSGWHLNFANIRAEQFFDRVDPNDFLFESEASLIGVYQPVLTAFGVDPSILE